MGVVRICSSSCIPDGQPATGNPNPSRYIVEQIAEHGRWLILDIRYPDCTNYEGRKILVFKDVTLDEIKKRNKGKIDPHFANNPPYVHPIARFVPTKRGVEMACQFVACMAQVDEMRGVK